MGFFQWEGGLVGVFIFQCSCNQSCGQPGVDDGLEQYMENEEKFTFNGIFIGTEGDGWLMEEVNGSSWWWVFHLSGGWRGGRLQLPSVIRSIKLVRPLLQYNIDLLWDVGGGDIY